MSHTNQHVIGQHCTTPALQDTHLPTALTEGYSLPTENGLCDQQLNPKAGLTLSELCPVPDVRG